MQFATGRPLRPRPVLAEGEQIRRREVSRILKKVDLSPEEEEIIERFSHTLVAELLLGPISEVMGSLGPRRAPRVRR